MSKFYLRTSNGSVCMQEKEIKGMINLEFSIEEVMQSSFLTNLFYSNTSILLDMNHGSCNNTVDVEGTCFIQSHLGVVEGVILKDNYKQLFYEVINEQIDSIVKDIEKIEATGKGTIRNRLLNNYSIFKQWHKTSRFNHIEWKEIVHNAFYNENCWIRVAIEGIHDLIDYLKFLKFETENKECQHVKNLKVDFRSLLRQNKHNISDFINKTIEDFKEEESYPKNAMWFSIALNNEANFFYLKGEELLCQCDLVVASFLGNYFAIPRRELSRVLCVEPCDISNCFRDKLNRKDIKFI